jgi:predicted metal-dependent peptidase
MDIEKFNKYVDYSKFVLMVNTPFWGYLIKQVDVILLPDKKYGDGSVSAEDDEQQSIMIGENLDTDKMMEGLIKNDIIESKKNQKKMKNFGVKTNGKNIFFQESHFETLTKQQFCGQYYKQLLHIAFLHIPRKYNKEDKKWNIACDFWANIVLDDFQNSSKNKMGNYIDYKPDFMDRKFENKSIEEIYEEIISEDGDGGKGKGKGEDFSDYVPNLDFNSKDRLSQDDVENIKSNMAKGVALTDMHGVDSDHIRREIDKLLTKKVDWRQELKQFIQSFPNDYDFLQRDRRFYGSQFFIPAIGGETVKIVVALDTSGSIIDDVLKYFMSEVISICQTFENLEMTVICCDADVKSVGKVYTINDVDKIELSGGGGTSFVPVFEYCEEFLTDFNALIYFTDGYGDFPNPNDVNIKTLWIMTTEVQPEFGKIIKFEINDNNNPFN